MFSVTYIGTNDPTDDVECTVFGMTFTKGQSVKVADVPAKIAANPTFKVEGSRRRAAEAAVEEAPAE